MNTEDDMEKEDEDGETLRPKVKLGYVTPWDQAGCPKDSGEGRVLLRLLQQGSAFAP